MDRHPPLVRHCLSVLCTLPIMMILLPMSSSFPFLPNSMRGFIQKNLVSVIYSHHFSFQLPQLTEACWELISHNDEERERLEFVGDALMSACIAIDLYGTYPNGTPGFYTVRDLHASSPTLILNLQRIERPQCADYERNLCSPRRESWFP